MTTHDNDKAHDTNIVIPKGCHCVDVEIGEYANQVELPTPDHMRRLGGDGWYEYRPTTCIDRCLRAAYQGTVGQGRYHHRMLLRSQQSQWLYWHPVARRFRDRKAMISDVICIIVALLIGIYVGVFFGEASVIYECEKDGTTTISGAFWKGEMKYTCHRPAAG